MDNSDTFTPGFRDKPVFSDKVNYSSFSSLRLQVFAGCPIKDSFHVVRHPRLQCFLPSRVHGSALFKRPSPCFFWKPASETDLGLRTRFADLCELPAMSERSSQTLQGSISAWGASCLQRTIPRGSAFVCFVSCGKVSTSKPVVPVSLAPPPRMF